jgi:hypothetical protein
MAGPGTTTAGTAGMISGGMIGVEDPEEEGVLISTTEEAGSESVEIDSEPAYEAGAGLLGGEKKRYGFSTGGGKSSDIVLPMGDLGSLAERLDAVKVDLEERDDAEWLRF